MGRFLLNSQKSAPQLSPLLPSPVAGPFSDFVQSPSVRPPLIVHIPHASVEIPEAVAETFLLAPSALQEELRVMTDHYTDELFWLPASIATLVRYPYSRLVADPERFVEDEREPMAKAGMGVLYERSSSGEKLRKALSMGEREQLLAQTYWPHHKHLERSVALALTQHVRCLIIDAHSFASSPLPHEADQDADRPDICLGSDEYHTPRQLVGRATECFQNLGYRVAENRPFAGTLVPAGFYRHNPQVWSLMIEVNRSLYIDEQSLQKKPHFELLRRHLSETIGELSALLVC